MTREASAPVAARLYAGPGLVPFGLDMVVKFGGSLLADVGLARRVVAELVSAHTGQRLAVIPGGGPTDNLLERIAREAGLTDPVINPACMRAMDQTGIVLAGLAPGMATAETLAEVRSVLRRDLVPVLLPSSLILALDVFTRESVITSDTLGAYLAFLLGAPQYVILTDVDGVFRSFQDGQGDGLVSACTPAELTQLGQTSVDACLAPFLDAVGMTTWVLNGSHPQRLSQLASGETPVGTRIAPA
jgi:hypothetical protein